MHLKTAYIALAAVVLPSMPGIPSASRTVQLAARALCEDSASASVAEIATVAGYLAELAAHPSMPVELRELFLAVRASLMERRVRIQPCTAGRRRRRRCASGSLTATMQVQVR